VYTVQATKLLQ